MLSQGSPRTDRGDRGDRKQESCAWVPLHTSSHRCPCHLPPPARRLYALSLSPPVLLLHPLSLHLLPHSALPYSPALASLHAAHSMAISMGMSKFVATMAAAVPGFVAERRRRGLAPTQPDAQVGTSLWSRTRLHVALGHTSGATHIHTHTHTHTNFLIGFILQSHYSRVSH